MAKLKRLMRIPKKAIAQLKLLPMRKEGYSWYAARTWKSKMKADLNAKNRITKDKKTLFHKKGFLSYRIQQYGLTEENYGNYVSDRDYLWTYPLNSSYSKWINDELTFKHILQTFPQYLPEYYYHVIKRDGRQLLLRLMDLPDSFDTGYADVVRLLREKEDLLLKPSNPHAGYIYHLRYDSQSNAYYINGNSTSEYGIEYTIKQRNPFYLITEYPKQTKDFSSIYGDFLNIIRLVIINEHGDDPVLAEASVRFSRHGNNAFSKKDTGKLVAQVNLETGEFNGAKTVKGYSIVSLANHPNSNVPISGQIQNWGSIVEQVLEISLDMREVEYMALDIVPTDDGFKIMRFKPYPDLPRTYVHSSVTKAYIERKAALKRDVKRSKMISWQDFKNLFMRVFQRFFCQPGFLPYWAVEWTKSLMKDFFTFRGTTLKEKFWCYKRGFLSYHKAQYNLTEENWRDFVSDREYHWLCPINNSYFKWIDDKVTYRYVMEPCKEYLPEYYFHLIKRNGALCIVPMQDCPPGYSADFEGILALIRDKGQLALKQSSGTHGDGFFKLSYEDGKYYINNEPSDSEQIIDRISTLSCFYNLTEYLAMHPALGRIYDGSVNTIRVMALNRDGKTPEIVNAYMRIGAVSTGLTDNVGYGGVFCRVDIEDGHFHDAEQSINHVIKPCPNHPDTGVLIDGIIPLWEEAKDAVKKMCLTIPQLEYLGFDVAITNKGVKILEINKHQDLHRCPEYGPYIQGFFKEKIERKRKALRLDENWRKIK